MDDRKDLIERARAHVDGLHGNGDLAVGPRMLVQMVVDLANALDGLAEREAETYRNGQEDMRERAAQEMDEGAAFWAEKGNDYERAVWENKAKAIRALPIKEKDDE